VLLRPRVAQKKKKKKKKKIKKNYFFIFFFLKNFFSHMELLFNHVLTKRSWSHYATLAPFKFKEGELYVWKHASALILYGAVWKRAPLEELIQKRCSEVQHVVVFAERFTFRENFLQLDDIYIELFTRAFCEFDRTLSFLVPLCEKLNEDAISAFERKHGVARTSLPILLRDDVQARVYGFRMGDVVFLPAKQELRYVA
jgi:DNA-directed RNA polymerase subunit H (RpoH/RPB5)